MSRLDNQAYPTTSQGLAALVERPSAPPEPANWVDGGYLASLPQDPWGRDYIYASPGGDGAPFELVSLGSDGEPGGDGTGADLSHGQAVVAN